MSYYFGMYFVECEPENVLDKCLSVLKTIMNNAEDIIKDELHYAPSKKHKDLIDANIAKRYDEAWLYQVFNFPFVYWSEYKLLGLSGYDYPKEVEEEFTLHVEFQNGTDQNYEYSTWEGISCFDKWVQESKTISIPDMVAAFGEYSYYDEEELNQDKDMELYSRQSLVYETVYKNLDLDNWLYGRDGNFKIITLNGIPNSETLFELSLQLRVLTSEDE